MTNNKQSSLEFLSFIKSWKMKTMNSNKPITAFFNTMAVMYLLFVFYSWSWNPKDWGEVGRLCYVMFSPIFSLVVYSIVLEKQNKTSEKQ